MKLSHFGRRKLNFVLILSVALWLGGCGLFGSDRKETGTCTNAVNEEWTFLGIPEEIIHAIAVNPHNPSHILVGTASNFSDGTQGKIYRSTNCGETWQQVWEGGNILEIQFDPQSPDIVYANPYGMIRSSNGGKNWSHISDGLSDYLSFTSGVSTFAIDPAKPQRLYAGTQNLGGGLIFFTDNGGLQWQLIPSHQGKDGGIDISKNAVEFIEIDPVNPNHIYAGVGHIMRSKNRGQSWEMIREVDRSIIRTAAFSADNMKIYAMDGRLGFYTYYLPEGPWEFNPYPDSLIRTPVHIIEDSPLSSGILIGSGIGVLLRKDGIYSSMVDNLPINHTSAMRLNGKNLYVGSTHVEHLGIHGGVYVRRID